MSRANLGASLYRALPAIVAAYALISAATGQAAEKLYGPGVSDTEIKLGQTMPYSGPVSGYASIGLAEAAYFEMLNEQGGINGRKIRLISLDDGYIPAKTVEQTRRLVESEQVLAVVGSLGTASNSAVQRYLNQNKVPQLFIATGAAKWGDPKNFPWTMGWAPNYQAEGHVYAEYIRANVPNARVAILFQNDDYGKDYVKGFRDGLGEAADTLIVAQASYEVTDPTVDSQIVALQASDASVFFNVTTPKFAAQSIRKAYDIGWRPLQIINSVGSSTGAVMKPVGFERTQGLISAHYQKDATDPRWQEDRGMQQYLAFMKQHVPKLDVADTGTYTGYNVAINVAYLLKQCGDDLTRETLMKQATSMRDLDLPMLLPGVKVGTSPTDYYPISQMQLVKFEGDGWVLFGDVLDGS